MLHLNILISATLQYYCIKIPFQNLANFFLGIPSILLSLCGVFLCTYATFIDAKNDSSSEVPFIIAGMQISCYIESVTSLFIVINCWMQMDSKSCKCTCACMGIQCACGDDSVRDAFITIFAFTIN